MYYSISHKSHGLIKFEIVESEEISVNGYWNIDTNKVIMSKPVFREFNRTNDQEVKRKIFDSLTKIRNQAIPHSHILNHAN